MFEVTMFHLILHAPQTDEWATSVLNAGELKLNININDKMSIWVDIDLGGLFE